MGKAPDGLSTLRVIAVPELTRAERLVAEWASVLHARWRMEALVLTTTMTLSGLLALAGTRAVLGVVLLAITRDRSSG
jgi:hypothetical protein